MESLQCQISTARQDIEPYWSNCTNNQWNQWDDLINLHNHEYAMKSMSMSRAISETIEYKLTEIGAQKRLLFSKKYRPIQYLEKLGPIAIEYAFGHPDGIQKLNKLATAIIPNKYSMQNQCQVGILIVATESLRRLRSLMLKQTGKLQ